VTGRTFVAEVFEALGQPPRMRRLGRGMLTLACLFSRQIRELYQFEQPFVMDTSKFERMFGGSITPLRRAFDRRSPLCEPPSECVPPATHNQPLCPRPQLMYQPPLTLMAWPVA